MATIDANSAKWIGPALGAVSIVPDAGAASKVSIRYMAGKVGGTFSVQSPFESWAIAETQMKRLKNKSVSVPVPKVSRAGFVMPSVAAGAVAIGSMLDAINAWRINSDDELARSLGLSENSFETPEILARFKEDKEIIGWVSKITEAVSENLPAFLPMQSLAGAKTKKRVKGPKRILIHGYSRRSGSTVKDFRRKSPRKK